MKIDIEKMMNFKLSAEGVFILDCLYNDNADVLEVYVKNIRKIRLEVFTSLEKEGWLTNSTDTNVFTRPSIELTDKYQVEYLAIPKEKEVTFEEAFIELRGKYPVKTESKRRLQGNVDKCKVLYKKVIYQGGRVNYKLHTKILSCIQLEINERVKNKSMEYFQMLVTWLNQKNWDLYMEDVEEALETTGKIVSAEINNDGKTIIGKEEF